MFKAANLTRIFFIFLLVTNLHAQQKLCKKEIEIGAYYRFMIFVTYWSGEVGFTYSNGVIISPKHVLTTAQFLSQRKCGRNVITRKYNCIPADPSEYEVVAGRAYVISSSETAFIGVGKAISIHPKFKDELSYGIGILTLKDPFKLSNRVGVQDYYKGPASFYLDEHEYCTIFTYGISPCSRTFTKTVRTNKYSFKTGENFQRLQRVTILPIDVNKRQKMCNDLLKKRAEADMTLNRDKIMCARSNFSSKHCYNFAGSGLWCNNEMIGLVLQPMNCYYSDQPVLFLKLGEVADWIEKILNEN